MIGTQTKSKLVSDVPAAKKPRVGFLGVGWIGRSRLEAIRKSQRAEIVAICDADPSIARAVCDETSAQLSADYHQLLSEKPDGVIIATPSAQHSLQALEALELGIAVFCQKPLARTLEETRKVVEKAREKDCLLMVDYSYRYTDAMRQVKYVVDSGRLGKIFSVELVFHNAYGPDKSWYRDPRQSGGGCLMDLGVHLADLLLWTLPGCDPEVLCSRLYARGERLGKGREQVEDFAEAFIGLKQGGMARLACSWNISAGTDAVIEVSFTGENGAVRFRNISGSFFDFQAEFCKGTSRQVLSTPPDDWSGRAAIRWTEALSRANRFDPLAETYVQTAALVDKIYEHCDA